MSRTTASLHAMLKLLVQGLKTCKTRDGRAACALPTRDTRHMGKPKDRQTCTADAVMLMVHATPKTRWYCPGARLSRPAGISRRIDGATEEHPPYDQGQTRSRSKATAVGGPFRA